jgi:putative flippase GtrA
MNQRPSPFRQPISFIAVGASSAALYFVLLWALQDRIANTLILTAGCYLASMIYNFGLQGWLTFGSGRPSRRRFFRFAVVHALAMTVNSLLMWGLVDGLAMPLIASQLLVTAGITVAVFLASKHWIYRTDPPGN